MAFNTPVFILFFVVVLLLYALMPKRYKWIWLLAASWFFYLYASAKFFIFVLLTGASAWAGALYMQKLHDRERQLRSCAVRQEDLKQLRERLQRRRKRMLISVLVLNFGILAVLKYLGFFCENLNQLLASFSLEARIPGFHLILPLGISFYTFQTMSYVIDVYWRKTQAEHNPFKVSLFVSFFPQIIEGPIGRWNDLAAQLSAERACSALDVRRGLQLMLWGYFKKMVIADRAAIVADFVFSHYLDLSGFGIAAGVFLYAIQDYADFSGCIDIARGCAKTMGIDMADNFRRPYFSRTIPEFWRRWHMSLGAWMKDYVFYPFSLAKGVRRIGKTARKRWGRHLGSTLPIALGNLLVFFLVGLWHGASWNYIVWGLFYGILIALSALLKPLFDKLRTWLHIPAHSRAFMLFQILRTFAITCAGCVIFRAATLGDAAGIFTGLFRGAFFSEAWKSELLSLGLDKWNWAAMLGSLLILLIVDLMQEKLSVREWLDRRSAPLRWSVCAIGCLLLIMLAVYGPGTSPVQFVYMQY